MNTKLINTNTAMKSEMAIWLRTSLCAFLSAVSLMGQSKLAQDLTAVPGGKSDVDVIIQFSPGKGDKGKSDAAGQGGALKRHFGITNSALYRMPVKALAALSKNPNVAYIAPDRALNGSMQYAEPTVRADIANSYGWNGMGIGVAIIDSGVMASHPDFTNEPGQSRVVYAESFVAGDPSTNDAFGHGTHVAGIVAGNAARSSGPGKTVFFMGIAPKVNIISLRVLDGQGVGTDSGVIAAIEKAIQLKSQYNIRVINLSLGRKVMESYQFDPMCQAVEQAWNAGIVVVVSAGNRGRDNSMKTKGYGTIASPGNDPFVITVGAMNDKKSVSRADDVITSFSSKGPTLLDRIAKPDLVAPGNEIIAAFSLNSGIGSLAPRNIVAASFYNVKGSSDPGNAYIRLSGTSMAAPMVSGAAALLLQKDPTLSPDAVKARLMKSASKSMPPSSSYTDTVTNTTYLAQYDIFTVGAGYLDVWAALNDTTVVPSGKMALSAKAIRNPVTKVISLSVLWGDSLLSGNSVLWGDSLLWGDSIVWGTNVFLSGTSVLWGNSVVWGNGNIEGYSLLWGDSVLWGDSLIWGTMFPEGLSEVGDEEPDPVP